MKKYMMILLTAILAVGMVIVSAPDATAQSKKTTTSKQKKVSKKQPEKVKVESAKGQTNEYRDKMCEYEDMVEMDVLKEESIDRMQVVTITQEGNCSYSDKEQDPDYVFTAVEQQPMFSGGQSALSRWLGTNLKYPDEALENGVEGRVIIQFIVEKDGRLTDAKVIKGVDESLDNEALRVVRAMPKWEPGMNNGKVVRSTFILPIVFKLQA